MSDHYNLFQPVDKQDGSTYWHKIGIAFPKKSNSFSLLFNSLPISNRDGKVIVHMFKDEPREDVEDKRQQEKEDTLSQDDLDDDIPF